MTALRNWRTDLPAGVRRGLLVGAEGSVQLMDLAQQTLLAGQTAGPGQKGLLDAGVHFLLAAWSKDPLNGQLAEQVLALQAKWPCVDSPTCALLQAVLARWAKPADTRYYRRLLEGGDSEKLHHFLSSQLDREPENIYWWRQNLAFAQYEEDWDLAHRVVSRAGWPASIAAVQHSLLGDVLWLQGKTDEACGHYAQAYGLDARFRLAINAVHNEGLEASRTHWQSLLTAAPWMTLAVLVCHDALRQFSRCRAEVAGRGVVALYSFNKAAELDVTLASVLASRLGSAQVWVLNNGSTDATAEVLTRWQDRAGGRLRVITLPVNVGAPAARNWLLHEAAKASMDWMAYVDDDVELSEDWLEMLGAAAQEYPDAGVWGCKVVDAATPVVLQSVDLHLAPADEEDKDRRFKLSDLQHQTLDFGQFDYIRPCSSVTGCCHLFRMDRLLECGDFDLRFSPTQYDDLEHDIRLNLEGRYAVYQGHLRILHLKRTGKGTRGDAAQFGSAMANMHKLQKKYSVAQYAKLIAWEEEVLAQDYWRKHEQVMQWLREES